MGILWKTNGILVKREENMRANVNLDQVEPWIKLDFIHYGID